jgi:hypothetical protein
LAAGPSRNVVASSTSARTNPAASTIDDPAGFHVITREALVGPKKKEDRLAEFDELPTDFGHCRRA